MDPIRQRRAQPEQLTGKGETKRVNETYFEQLLQWLARCPALAGIALRVDDLPPAALMILLLIEEKILIIIS